MSQPDTKQKILDSAEELFAHGGFHAVSLRAITQSAGVNLAAVNYHFGSKEALLDAVIGRRLEPLNARRLELLERELHSARAGQRRPEVREVWRAMVAPTLQLRDPASGAGHFVTLVGRLLSEPHGPAREVFLKQMAPLLMRLFEALREALPALDASRLFWRVHFCVGALAHLLRCDLDKLPLPPGIDPHLATDDLVEALLDFSVAGLEVGL